MTAETKRKENGLCPYFSKALKACELGTQGIYLPPRVHVLTYCLSEKFFRCSVYTQFIPPDDAASRPEKAGAGNRRRFERINDQKQVLIRTCSPDGAVVGDFSELAVTSDYSPQGMRILLKGHLPERTLLLFDFDSDFLIPSLQGMAEIRWHRHHGNGPETMEAGLVFIDEHSRKVLGLMIEEVP
jgi:hypothetical protein